MEISAVDPNPATAIETAISMISRRSLTTPPESAGA
jgi:hypothetical protein